MSAHGPDDKGHDKPKQITIHIDGREYKVDSAELTSAQIRAIPDPDIGSEYDLWLDVPGGDDRKIDGDEVVKLKNGIHFFSTHTHINPGTNAS